MNTDFKITDLMTNKQTNSKSNNSSPPKFDSSKQIPMLSIRNLIITSTGMGIPWLILLILCAFLIFI